MKYYLRGLLYNKEVAALQKSLSSCPTFVPWDVEIRPCTSGSSNECQQQASRSTELQFPPTITSISRSLFANSRALAKSFSSVVFLVRLSRQFGLTVWKAAWQSEISSRYIGGEPGRFYRLYCDWGDKVARQDYQNFKVIPRKRKTAHVSLSTPHVTESIVVKPTLFHGRENETVDRWLQRFSLYLTNEKISPSSDQAAVKHEKLNEKYNCLDLRNEYKMCYLIQGRRADIQA